MILQRFAVVAAGILVTCSLFLLVNRNWRRAIIALAIMYFGVFWLVSLVWPVGLAVVKLVVGWMAGAVLGASAQTASPEQQEPEIRPVQIFRLVAGGIVILLVFSLTPVFLEWLLIDQTVLWGAMILIGMGLLQLGMTSQPFYLFIGLLTTLAGFEVIYAALESSVLLAGLQALINLGLALTGAYLLSAASIEEAP